MATVVKVTISLPAALLRAAERERRARKETRSQFFRNALEAALARRREREASERYVQAYLTQPETEAEVSPIHQASWAVLASEPW